jgi:hypothetical protein
MKVACKSPSYVYRDDCNVAYEICTVGAKAKVRSYYLGHGADLSTIAARYAHANYSAGNLAAIEGATAGCLAALGAEYDRLYR